MDPSARTDLISDEPGNIPSNGLHNGLRQSTFVCSGLCWCFCRSRIKSTFRLIVVQLSAARHDACPIGHSTRVVSKDNQNDSNLRRYLYCHWAIVFSSSINTCHWAIVFSSFNITCYWAGVFSSSINTCHWANVFSSSINAYHWAVIFSSSINTCFEGWNRSVLFQFGNYISHQYSLGFDFWRQKPVFDVTLSKAWFEPAKEFVTSKTVKNCQKILW